jgi:hypothetical protein
MSCSMLGARTRRSGWRFAFGAMLSLEADDQVRSSKVEDAYAVESGMRVASQGQVRGGDVTAQLRVSGSGSGRVE